MTIRDLTKNWNEALASALSEQKPEISDKDLETTALDVRSGVVAGGVTSGPTCGCGTLLVGVYC